MTALNSEAPIPNSWHGNLKLVYAHRQGTTVLQSSQNQAPLKVQRPFYPEGREVCHSVILHTAGGVVGGDRLSIDCQLQENASALITTASAGKIYRSNGLQARQTINIQVGTDACLEWLPQETIVFNSANYRQDLQVELALKASYLGWEITRFGRSARREMFCQGEWRSHTEVWQQGNPLWIDRQWLPGSTEVFHSPHGLAGQPVVGSLVWIGQAVSPEIVETARSFMGLKSQPIPSGKLLAGVTRLPHGLLCRYRGSSTREVRNWFTEVWQLLRLSCLQRTSCVPRVWQV